MNNRFLNMLILGLALSFSGCIEFMTGAKVSQSVSQPIEYTGPKVSIAVNEIANRTGVQTEVIKTGTTIQTGAASAAPVKNVTVRDPIGSGMKDQLITALTQTGVFSVSTGKGSARYMLEGAVTEYEPSQASIAGVTDGEEAQAEPVIRQSEEAMCLYRFSWIRQWQALVNRII